MSARNSTRIGVGLGLAALAAVFTQAIGSRESQSALEARVLAHLDARFDALDRAVLESLQNSSPAESQPETGLRKPTRTASLRQGSAAEIATIQQQLQRILDRLEASPGPSTRGDATPAAQPRVDAREAEEASWLVVEGAIARGRWTGADARVLADSFDGLDDRQRLALLKVLIPALNRGEIELENGRTLF